MFTHVFLVHQYNQRVFCKKPVGVLAEFHFAKLYFCFVLDDIQNFGDAHPGTCLSFRLAAFLPVSFVRIFFASRGLIFICVLISWY